MFNGRKLAGKSGGFGALRNGRGGQLTSAKIENSDAIVDISLVDLMGIDEFLSHLRNKTDSRSADLWKLTSTLALQLKASRELISIGSNLMSNNSSQKILSRLIGSAHIILNAERVFIWEYEKATDELMITHSLQPAAVGTRIPCSKGIEGDVMAKKSYSIVPDVTTDARYLPITESFSPSRTKCVLCAPIIVDDVAVGVIEVVNKLMPGKIITPRDATSSTSFSTTEALLLTFIASNAALALRPTIDRPSTPIQQISDIPIKSPIKSRFSSAALVTLDSEPSFQGLLERAYLKLAAERVSIFIYSSASKSLVCAASQDIKGFSIPSDKGFAGLSFTSMRIVNVADTMEDLRHNKDVDHRVGYTTRNLLCAPILDSDGAALGVIQAVNKKGESYFTQFDEEVIAELCRNLGSLLKDKVASDNKPTKGVSSDALMFGIHTAKMAAATSIEGLGAEVNAAIKSLLDFDFVGLYVLDHDSLLPVGVYGENLSIRVGNSIAAVNLPLHVKQVLQFDSIVEYQRQPSDGQVVEFLPNLSLQKAVIVPLATRVHSYRPGTCVLVAGSTSPSNLATLESAKSNIQSLLPFIESSLKQLNERLAYEESVKTLKNNFLLLNSTLGAFKDFVILLNGDGHFVACNKLLEELVGHRDDWKQEHGATVFDGMHYQQWLSRGNSTALMDDIASVLSGAKERCQDGVVFTSPVHSSGITVDYEVLPISSLETQPSLDPLASISLAEDGPAILTTNSTDTTHSSENGNGFAVVVVIKIAKSQSFKPSNHGFLSSHHELTNVAHIDTHSAHGVVAAATSILNSVRNSFDLDTETQETLKSITAKLSDTGRRLSIANTHLSGLAAALATVNCPLVNPAIPLPADVFEWEFDVLKISDGMILCNIIGKLFDTLVNLTEMRVNPSTMAHFIIEVAKNYHDRPFHNLQHSTCVTHFSFMLMRATKAGENLQPHQLFGVLVSAVVHDVDHPGNTNLFEVNSSSELALRYNDQSVLENHHCSTAFRLMRKPNTQILANLPKNLAVEVRKIIISCVMATDMAVHFELIDETKKRAIEGWNFGEAKDQVLLGKVLLHAADLSNPVRPFHMTREWARRISLEFNDQVQREQELGMPVLGFMMTPDEKAFCKNETGFASFVVAPMWRSIALVYPNLSFLVDQLDSNLQTWKSLLEKIAAEEAAASSVASTPK